MRSKRKKDEKLQVKNKEILPESLTQSAGRPNIDNLLKRIINERKQERRNGIITIFFSFLALGILTFLISIK